MVSLYLQFLRSVPFCQGFYVALTLLETSRRSPKSGVALVDRQFGLSTRQALTTPVNGRFALRQS